MTYEQAACKELASMLRSHRKLVGGEFNLVSLIDSLGHDSRDWGNLAIDEIYQYWAKAYSSRYDEKTAAAKAHMIAAHRAGSLLKETLKKFHKGQYETVGRANVGRFGGPMTYRWLNT